MNNELLSKLKKLLNLSKSTNEHEADLALQKAQELATNAGIDLAIVAARGEDKAEKLDMTRENVNFGGRLPTTQKYASWILQSFFEVTIIYSGGRGSRYITILGDRKDVEFAKFANEVIQDEMQRRWENYKKLNNLSVKLKSTFLYNCYRGLRDKLDEAKRATETTRFAAMPEPVRVITQSTYALVLSTKKDAVDAFVSNSYPNLRHSTTRVSTQPNSEVASAAFAIGKSININRPLSC